MPIFGAATVYFSLTDKQQEHVKSSAKALYNGASAFASQYKSKDMKLKYVTEDKLGRTFDSFECSPDGGVNALLIEKDYPWFDDRHIINTGADGKITWKYNHTDQMNRKSMRIFH